MLDGLADAPVQRFPVPRYAGRARSLRHRAFLPRSGGALPHLRFDFHAHNDYDLAVANTAAAVRRVSTGFMSPSTGWADAPAMRRCRGTVAVLHDRLGCKTGIDETKINRVSRARSSRIRACAFPPTVRSWAKASYAVAGIHADGDNKEQPLFQRTAARTLAASANTRWQDPGKRQHPQNPKCWRVFTSAIMA